MELTVTVHQERASFWSEVAGLPGCLASGGTLAELTEALAESVGLYLWDVPALASPQTLVVGESRISITPPPGHRDDQ